MTEPRELRVHVRVTARHRGLWVALCVALFGAVGVALFGAAGCNSDSTNATGAATAVVPSVSATVSATVAAPVPSAIPAPPKRDKLTLIAGGDIFFGRIVGQVLLAKPETDIFADVQSLLDSADLRFGNLECQLSEQKGVTVHPENRLVFTGPPSGADALARAKFDIVSLANNHMWDFGKDALWETFTNLERVNIKYVGAGRDRATAYGPVFIERDGFKVAFVAVTDIWNMGPLARHPAREFVARADPELVRASVEPLKQDPTVDAIVVSYHGGSEYMEEPTLPTRKVIHAAVDAGADVVIAHHPHVPQGISWYGGKPVLYSLGNFTMGMKGEHPWSQFGYLARIALMRDKTPAVEVCPFIIDYFTPRPLNAPKLSASATYFFRKLRSLSKRVAGSTIAEPGADGCARVTPPEQPFPGAIP